MIIQEYDFDIKHKEDMNNWDPWDIKKAHTFKTTKTNLKIQEKIPKLAKAIEKHSRPPRQVVKYLSQVCGFKEFKIISLCIYRKQNDMQEHEDKLKSSKAQNDIVKAWKWIEMFESTRVIEHMNKKTS